MAYDVQTAVFDGPFDLLLHLILREQVDLYDVSLAHIVDAYLVELDRMGSLDLDVATEFVLIAATLVELKTRRLLPGEADVDIDDELALWSERDLLLSRLLECKTFKDAAGALARLANRAARSLPRRAGVEDWCLALTPDLLAGVGPLDLRAAFLRAAAPRPVARVDLDHVAPVRANVTDAVAELLDELPRAGRITFRALTEQLVERLDVVVRFLAVLELFKQGLIDLDQAESFGSIEVVWLGRSWPGADHQAQAGDLALDLTAPAGLVSVDAYEG